VKPMVKATMPTIKAETRKTCDTEPAAGGIARTMSSRAARRDCAARCARTELPGTQKGLPRQAADQQRTPWRLRDEEKESKSRAPAAFAGGALIGSSRGLVESKSVRNSVSM